MVPVHDPCFSACLHILGEEGPSNTAPYSPEMNGIAERLIRVLVEHASAMLWDARLPMAFWVPAMTAANFLSNRSPTSALSDQTPFQAWYGRPPNLGFIRLFGCRAQVHVPREIRSKTMWDSKSTDCILIGYSDTENIYELWDIEKGAVIKRRDVIFWEDELGSVSLQRHALQNGTYIFPVNTPQYPDEHAVPTNPTVRAAEHTTPTAHPHDNDNIASHSRSTPPAHAPRATDDIAHKYASDHIQTAPVHHATSPLISLPPRPSQQSIPRLPILAGGPPTSTDIPQFTWLPPITANIPSPAYTNTLFIDAAVPTFIDDAAVLHAFIRATYDAQSLGFSMVHGQVPRSYHDTMSRQDASRWLQAMNIQLQKLSHAGTWTLIPLPPGKRAIQCKWVF